MYAAQASRLSRWSGGPKRVRTLPPVHDTPVRILTPLGPLGQIIASGSLMHSPIVLQTTSPTSSQLPPPVGPEDTKTPSAAPVRKLVPSADGTHLAVAAGANSTALAIYDISKTNDVLRIPLAHSLGVTGLASVRGWRNDTTPLQWDLGSLFASSGAGDEGGEVKLWTGSSSASERESSLVTVLTPPTPSPVLSVDMDPHKVVVATGASLQTWDLATGTPLDTLVRPSGFDSIELVQTYAWNHPALVLSGSRLAELWDTRTGGVVIRYDARHRMPSHPNSPPQGSPSQTAFGGTGAGVPTPAAVLATLAPQGALAGTGGGQGHLAGAALLATAPGALGPAAPHATLGGGGLGGGAGHLHGHGIVSLRTNSSQLATLSASGTVHVWDPRSGRVRWSIGQEATEAITTFSLSDDVLASVTGEGFKLWDPLTGSLLTHQTYPFVSPEQGQGPGVALSHDSLIWALNSPLGSPTEPWLCQVRVYNASS